jgi:hypothetical protein
MILYCRTASFLQEIQPHRGEAVDEYAGFQTFAAVFEVGFHVQAIPCADDFGFVSDGESELAAGHEGGLGMEMGVCIALGTLFEFYFDEHDLTVVTHDLAGDSFAGGFPGEFFFIKEGLASGFHIKGGLMVLDFLQGTKIQLKTATFKSSTVFETFIPV